MAKLGDVKLGTKFMVAFLVVGIVPLAALGLISLFEASDALEEQAFNQLVAVRQIKKKQLDDYFARAFMEMGIFSRSKDIAELYDNLVRYHDETGVKADGAYNVTTAEYEDIYRLYGRNIQQFREESGFYDVFLICAAHGHVMFTCAREADLGTNLMYGPYKDSGLSQLWQKVIKSERRAVVDFSPYAPSGDAPAAFAGFPIFDANRRLLPGALQSPDNIRRQGFFAIQPRSFDQHGSFLMILQITAIDHPADITNVRHLNTVLARSGEQFHTLVQDFFIYPRVLRLTMNINHHQSRATRVDRLIINLPGWPADTAQRNIATYISARRHYYHSSQGNALNPVRHIICSLTGQYSIIVSALIMSR